MTGGGPRLPLLGAASASDAPAAFERIAIVGLGAVGGSIAMALRRAWPRSLVIGVDASDVVETAIRLHAVDVGAGDLMIAGEAEAIVVASGAAEADAVLPQLAEAVPGEAIVLVLAAPEAITRAAEIMPARLAVVAGLPSVKLRAPGIQAASADLFVGTPWPLAAVTGPAGALEKARQLVRAVGAVPGGGSLPH